MNDTGTPLTTGTSTEDIDLRVRVTPEQADAIRDGTIRTMSMGSTVQSIGSPSIDASFGLGVYYGNQSMGVGQGIYHPEPYIDPDCLVRSLRSLPKHELADVVMDVLMGKGDLQRQIKDAAAKATNTMLHAHLKETRELLTESSKVLVAAKADLEKTREALLLARQVVEEIAEEGDAHSRKLAQEALARLR